MSQVKWLLIAMLSCGLNPALAGSPDAVPLGVSLVKVAGAEFQLRALGLEHQGPALVLLSGPNEHWHSDSGWFALLQPLLAKKYRTYSIDRLGQGLSSDVADPSYRRFARDLLPVLQALNEPRIVLLSFASASVSTLLFVQQNPEFSVQGLLLIDPDIPGPASVALYKGYPADWYKANLAELLPALHKGVWTERTAKKLQQERALVQKLLAADYANQMDWIYYDFMAQQRLRIERQQSRAKEIAAYADDLDLYQTLPLYTQSPVSVINSDFEQQQIQQNPEKNAELKAWQQEGDDWSQLQAKKSGGQYLELKNSDHLVPFQQPGLIIQAVDWLLALPAK